MAWAVPTGPWCHSQYSQYQLGRSCTPRQDHHRRSRHPGRNDSCCRIEAEKVVAVEVAVAGSEMESVEEESATAVEK